jgi:tetratricopeptide (TPR) repeat protein
MLVKKNHFLILLLLIVSLFAGCKKDPKEQRDKYFASGQKYLDNKNFESAAIEFRNALSFDKGHIPSYLGMAKSFQKMGNHQDAIGVYQLIIKLDGKNIPARLQLGDYLIASGIQEPKLFQQAQEMAESVLKIDSKNVEGLVLLGNAYSGQNETDKAIEKYNQALGIDTGNLKALLNLGAVYVRKNEIEKANETFNLALQKHPEDIQAHLAIATFFSTQQRPQDVEFHLKKAFDLAPADSRSLYALSGYYLSAKKTVEAENVFKEAMKRKSGEREPLWGLASFYLQQGAADRGIETLQQLLKAHKGDKPALLRLAEIYLGRNNDAKAEEFIKAILANNRNDAQAHYFQGMIYRRQKQTDKAMAEFESAIKYNELLAPAYLEKANLQIQRGDFDACESTLKTVIQKSRNYLPAFGAYAKLLVIRQRPKEALQQAQDVLAVYPNNEDALGARAEALRLTGKLDESRKDWLKLCEMKPANPVYWHRLGIIEFNKGNKTAALANFRKALEANSSYLDAVNDSLYLLIQDKQYDAALTELDRISKTKAPQDEISKYRGQVYLAKKDMAAAESEFRKAVQINPKNYRVYLLLAQLNMQRNNLGQAIKEVDQLIAQNEKFAPAYLQKAFYLENKKDFSGAVANYQKALALDSENAIAANNLAWLLCEQNMELGQALSLARTAKKKMPEDPEIAETLGWAYYKMKNYTLAVDQLLFSINNRKDASAENYYRLGIALQAKGDLYLAKQTLQKSLQLNPKFSAADDARRLLSAK